MDIPDLVNMTQIDWYFQMTHHALWGFERGFYMNDSLTMDPMCFGSEFVNKTNQIYTMSQHGFWHNIIPEVALAYQFYYMLGEKCKFERAMNDLYRYCWNKGCTFGEIEDDIVKNILYMTRAILDACIVWYEGVPDD